jgi:hypothetical protein
MQFKNLLLGVLAVSVVAENTIAPVLKTITQDVIALNNTLASYSGDEEGLAAILDKSNTLLDDIKSGTETAKASPPLSFEDTLDLADLTATLAAYSTDNIDTLIAIKPKLAVNPATIPITRSVLVGLKDATQDFSAAIIQKLPLELEPVAQKLVDRIDADFERGIDAYSCV